MKIFDATAVIAFLSEMRFPEGFELLSKHYKLVIPKAVEAEIIKEPGKSYLAKLRKSKFVEVVTVDQELKQKIERSNPQLGPGECEAIAYSITVQNERKNCIISDDLKSRKLYESLNFKWTERLLEIMKEKGLIDDSTYESKTRKLQESPFYSRSTRK